MIVNRGATIITQTLELVESSSDEVSWNGVSVTLLKENKIWLILDLKQKHTALKHNFEKNPSLQGKSILILYYIWHVSVLIHDVNKCLFKRSAPSYPSVHYTEPY